MKNPERNPLVQRAHGFSVCPIVLNGRKRIRLPKRRRGCRFGVFALVDSHDVCIEDYPDEQCARTLFDACLKIRGLD